jgi:hypothetical protein
VRSFFFFKKKSLILQEVVNTLHIASCSLLASSHAMSAASLRLFTSAALIVAISAVRFGHYRALPLLRHCLAFAAVP